MENRSLDTFPPETADLLRAVKQRLRALYGDRLVEVVLFGSTARGDDRPESDVDLLVVLRGPVHRYDENKRLAKIVVDLMPQYDRGITPIVMDEATYHDGNWPLLRNVRAEGVPL